jgi:uncharacterized protein with ParB-like and HNH nuclease domain
MPGLDSLKTSNMGIGKLLLDRRLAVPKYQRSYSWTQDQVLDLWNDFIRALDESYNDYFLGTVVLSATADTDADDDDDEVPFVIDGQQRLATVSLLLVALRDLYLDEGKDQRVTLAERFLMDLNEDTLDLEPRLTLNEENAEFFQDTKLARPADRKSTAAKVESQRLLNKAFNLLTEKVASRKAEMGAGWEKDLVALQGLIRTKARVVILDVPDEANAYLIFETLNDRGLDLTIADLLKNYLFSRAGKNKIDTVKQHWDRAMGALDPGEDDKLTTTFLRHYWSSKYGHTREKELYGEIKDEVSSQKKAVEFASDLVDAARIYSAMRAPSHEYWKDYKSPTRDNLETLRLLDVSQSRPLLLAAMQQWKPPEINKTLKLLVAWTVRLIVVGGAGSGSTEAAFSKAAVDIRAGRIKDSKDLAQEFKSLVADDSEFENQFAVTRKRPRLSRYLLHALERKKDGTGSPELISNTDESKVDLEHVLPRDADLVNDWPEFTPEQHSSDVGRLGNLVLLDKNENGALNAKDFDAKAKVYKKSKLKLTAEVGNKTKYKAWNSESIKKRQKELAALAVKTWPHS